MDRVKPDRLEYIIDNSPDREPDHPDLGTEGYLTDGGQLAVIYDADRPVRWMASDTVEHPEDWR